MNDLCEVCGETFNGVFDKIIMESPDGIVYLHYSPCYNMWICEVVYNRPVQEPPLFI